MTFTGQNLRDNMEIRESPETETRDAADFAEVRRARNGPPQGQLRNGQKGGCFGVRQDSSTSRPRTLRGRRRGQDGFRDRVLTVHMEEMRGRDGVGNQAVASSPWGFYVRSYATSYASFPFSMEGFVGVSERPAFRGQVRMEGT